MGIFGKLGDKLKKIDLQVSNDPESVGAWFEDEVQNLFTPKYFKIIEKTHSFETNANRYVESSKNPDFIFEYMPTRERFAVECKFRRSLNQKGQLQWSNPEQLKRYQNFALHQKIPVFVVIGLSLEEEGDFMFNIPLSEAKYPALYESVFTRYERPIDKPFFWKNGKLD